ncbi:S49 family peptidase [Kibdelosporangium phytohabitans]|uniref:Peptidase S49 n=1 Tax=Kibdelosporangium phytohabitans TaxID=860235 RepID=A0A0N9HU57_9PSEU|nr:S49 family peptidase [Kibdelosporangium phytohabitans]ALG05609.1 peptidase S49 [Kibdelosporangium phytohabitans]MBE1466424.1 signal peptide peptidase SppA [Kibdelosporangium phytohabitans]
MSVTEKLVSRLPGLGDRIDRKPVVSVIKLHGVITPTPSPLGRGSISLNSVESALTRAFDHERLLAVALQVNSPGGAPTQSALVAERIRQLAARKNVPVIAFCEDVAASGGYWLACAADEIFAHGTSLVGSIGVISAGFGLTGLLERVGVERRVHTAGTNKMRLDPFQNEKPEDVEWLVGLQGQLHEQFVEWVSERRGDRLSKDHDDVFSGEVWTGAAAAERGLVDGLGTLRGVISQRYPDAEIAIAEPRRPLLARLGVGGGAAAGILGAAIQAVEHRATWSRFGL